MFRPGIIPRVPTTFERCGSGQERRFRFPVVRHRQTLFSLSGTPPGTPENAILTTQRGAPCNALVEVFSLVMPGGLSDRLSGALKIFRPATAAGFTRIIDQRGCSESGVPVTTRSSHKIGGAASWRHGRIDRASSASDGAFSRGFGLPSRYRPSERIRHNFRRGARMTGCRPVFREVLPPMAEQRRG